MLVSDVLKDRKFSILLSDEGAMPNPRATPPYKSAVVASVEC